jgi:type VI secretion system protein ImpA
VIIEAPQPAPPAPSVPGAAGIEPSDLNDAERRLAAICRFLRKENVYDIAPFLVLRGLRFGQIRYNGPEKIDTTTLEGPPPGIRSELKRLAAEGRWDELLEAAERAMELPCGRGWLDLQRYTVTALEAKGAWWTFVAEAVRTELRGLLTDIPALLDLTLCDDTPTANADTSQWIRNQVLHSTPSPAEPSASHERAPSEMEFKQLDSTNLGSSKDEPFDRALSEAREGRVGEALAILSRRLASEQSGRGRFLRRVQLAHVLVVAGQTAIATPILDELTSEIEHRSLETWEDASALAYPLSLLLECFTASGNREQDRALIYARICRLDPERALTLKT